MHTWLRMAALGLLLPLCGCLSLDGFNFDLSSFEFKPKRQEEAFTPAKPGPKVLIARPVPAKTAAATTIPRVEPPRCSAPATVRTVQPASVRAVQPAVRSTTSTKLPVGVTSTGRSKPKCKT